MRFILVSVDDKNNTKSIDIPDEIVVTNDQSTEKPIADENKQKEPIRLKTHQTSRLYGQ